MAKETSYIPFARKYRSTNFSELLGQEVLVKTLSYCIENNRLGQSYLLTGIRGVGKTSSARIIAKTVNCTDLQKKDANIFPCEKCENCLSFNKQNHPDIIEIDAASKTSVDDIREIIEGAEYRPLLGRMKFFIIDEIHMLSKSAFNALLKIVEEPPEHVVFIFATTEVQKIPLTVISRCQRYDLRRLNFTEIMQLISEISNKEKIKITDDALEIIANKSEGSARDAVSILDQASSYLHRAQGSSKIDSALINQMIGLLGSDTILKLVQHIVANDPEAAIALIDDIYKNASSLEYFIQGVSDFMASMTKYKVISNYHNPLYKHHEQEINNLLAGLSLDRLTILWQLFQNGLQDIKKTHNELIAMHMIAIKAIYACNMPGTEQILDAESVVIEESKTKQADTKDEFSKIFDFLKFCYGQKEIEGYYLLLNEVEVKSFDSGVMELAGSVSSDQKNALNKSLSDWSGGEWSINVTKAKEVTSLKDAMINKVKEAEDFRVIKKYFPNANVSDIIMQS